LNLYKYLIDLQIGEYSVCFKHYCMARNYKDVFRFAKKSIADHAFDDMCKLKKEKGENKWLGPGDTYLLEISNIEMVKEIELDNFVVLATEVLTPLVGILAMFPVHRKEDGSFYFANGDPVKPAYGMTEDHYKSFKYWYERLYDKKLS